MQKLGCLQEQQEFPRISQTALSLGHRKRGLGKVRKLCDDRERDGLPSKDCWASAATPALYSIGSMVFHQERLLSGQAFVHLLDPRGLLFTTWEGLGESGWLIPSSEVPSRLLHPTEENQTAR